MSIEVYSKKSEKRSTFFNARYDFNILATGRRNHILPQVAEPQHVYAGVAVIKETDHDAENGWICRRPQDEIPDADRLFVHA